MDEKPSPPWVMQSIWDSYLSKQLWRVSVRCSLHVIPESRSHDKEHFVVSSGEGQGMCLITSLLPGLQLPCMLAFAVIT